VTSQLAVEAAVAAAAAEQTVLRAADLQIDVALAAHAERCGRVLTAEQRAAVAEIAGSGLRLSALVGPAGTGKTTTMDALAAVWRQATGGRVIGLSPSQIAADLLAGQTALDLAGNTARWLHRAAADPDTWGIRPGDLLIVDEASMISDSHLGAVLARVNAADARVLLVGDPAQLPSPATGSAYSMVTGIPGAVVELAQVQRFDAGWERAASLRLRAGDPTGLDDYDRRARISGGSQDQVEEAAWRAWAADTNCGLASLLITSATADVTALNERARAARITAGQVDGQVSVGLADGTRAGAGDRIVTRRNHRLGDGTELVNRARWQAGRVHPDGSLDASPELPDATLGRRLRLPADYVAAHVELGYAATAYGAQGLSVDSAHAVVGIDGVDREALYVMASRGRQENRLYVQTRTETAGGELLRAVPALAVLGASLTRTGSEPSATETLAAEAEAVRSIATLAPVYESLAADEAARRHAATLTAVLPAAAATRLRQDPAGPALWREIFEAEIRGVNVTTLLRRTAGSRSLADAQSVAQVLRWRLGVELALHPPTGQWTGWAALTRPDPAAPEAPALHQAARLLDERSDQISRRALAQPPGWALQQLGPVPDDEPGRHAWQARAGVVAAWKEYAGIGPGDPTVIGPQPASPQPLATVLWAAAHQALGRPDRSPDWNTASQQQLEQLARWGTRARTLAPPHVDRQLWVAHHELREARTLLGHASAAVTTEATAAGGARGTVERALARVGSRETWVQTVEGKAERRAAWHTAAREAIAQGQRADRELGQRTRLRVDPHRGGTPPHQNTTQTAAANRHPNRGAPTARSHHQAAAQQLAAQPRRPKRLPVHAHAQEQAEPAIPQRRGPRLEAHATNDGDHHGHVSRAGSSP